jgi:hypothetical protein
MAWRACIGLTVAVVVLIPAAPAHADDDSYIAAVKAAGVNYGSVSAVIGTGHDICAALRSGTPIPEVLQHLAAEGFQLFEQGSLLGAASYNLCPETAPLVHRYAQANGGAGA